MFALTNKPDMAARLYKALNNMASDNRGTDVMKLIHHIAGVMIETYLVFDDPPQAMEASFEMLAHTLGCEPLAGKITEDALPPAYLIDRESERGRLAARIFFEDWLDCEYEFHNLMLTVIHFIMMEWEQDGLARSEAFRLLVEVSHKCMAYELAAQELCDLVIESKIAQEGWSLEDCISSLSALSGHYVGEMDLMTRLVPPQAHLFNENLDHTVSVMTQEATRLGVPVASDWRFGLPANDVPSNAPHDLISSMLPHCEAFFKVLRLEDYAERGVCCAKAAGRMIAVASGGELPEIDPIIAKPLAMAAITETYRAVYAEKIFALEAPHF